MPTDKPSQNHKPALGLTWAPHPAAQEIGGTQAVVPPFANGYGAIVDHNTRLSPDSFEVVCTRDGARDTTAWFGPRTRLTEEQAQQCLDEIKALPKYAPPAPPATKEVEGVKA